MSMGFFLMKLQTQLFFSILLVLSMVPINSAITSDGEALLSFKTAIGGSDGIFLHWRLEDPDPCNWKGVTCDSHTKRVIYLSLAYHKLIGSISAEIGKLNHLKQLALNGNSLYGTVPPELGNCTELQYLYLQGNYLSGSIPWEFGSLLELETLDISSNTLSGFIPTSLDKLTKLKSFNVSMNFLTGPIPSVGVLIKFTETSFIGNRELCGEQIDVVCKDEVWLPSVDSQPSLDFWHQKEIK